MITFTERHEVRNYNTGLLLARLRPLPKTERAEQIEALRIALAGPFGVLIDALEKASNQGKIK